MFAVSIDCRSHACPSLMSAVGFHRSGKGHFAYNVERARNPRAQLPERQAITAVHTSSTSLAAKSSTSAVLESTGGCDLRNGKYCLACRIAIPSESAASRTGTRLTDVLQRYVLPKLVTTKARIAALHQHSLSNYDKLLLSVHALLGGSGSLYATTRSRLEARTVAADPTLPPSAQADIAGSYEPDKKGAEVPDEAEKALDADADKELGNDTAEPAAVRLTAPLCTSLEKLASALSSYAPAVEAAPSWDKLTKTEEPTASQSLIKSLETLTNFLTNESFYASTPSFPASAYGYNYGAGNTMPSRSGTDKEKIQQVKGEIRSLKGALLTRKNFATAK